MKTSMDMSENTKEGSSEMGFKTFLKQHLYRLPPYGVLILISIIHLGFCIRDYVHQPTVTKVTYITPTKAEVEMPIILVCPSRWLNKTRMAEQNVSIELMEYLRSGFFNFLIYKRKNTSSTRPEPRATDFLNRVYLKIVTAMPMINEGIKNGLDGKFMQWQMTRKDKNFIHYGKLFESLSAEHVNVKSCKWKGSEYVNCIRKGPKVTQQVLTDTGLCVEVNLSNYKQILPGPAGGFKFTSEIDDDVEPAIINNVPFNSGIHMYINGEWTPTLVSQPVFATWGSRVYIGVNFLKYRRISNCVQSEGKRLTLFDRRYSRAGCLYECLVTHLLAHCNCTLFTYNIQVDPGKFCTPHGFNTCAKRYMHLKGEIYQNCTGQCVQPCAETEVQLSLTYSQNDPDKIHLYNTRWNRNWSQNSCTVYIYHQNIGYKLVEELKSVTIATLLSNIGGQLGLWLGVSVLTFLSLISKFVEAKSRAYLHPTVSQTSDVL